VLAVEEIMRFDGPADASLLRVATEDVQIAGTTVRRGEAVLTIAGSANFDVAQFPDPERFDITRTNHAHLGFGHGIHFCSAHPLPAGAQVAFEACTAGSRACASRYRPTRCRGGRRCPSGGRWACRSPGSSGAGN